LSFLSGCVITYVSRTKTRFILAKPSRDFTTYANAKRGFDEQKEDAAGTKQEWQRASHREHAHGEATCDDHSET
jgi:hypothetical protein